MTTASLPPELLEEQRGDVLWLTINREERRNAINSGVLQGLSAAMTRANQDRAIRAIVITGAGERAFCAGAETCKPAPRSSSTIPNPLPASPICSGRHASARCR